MRSDARLDEVTVVFDDATGQPVVGAEVVDLATGTKALTSVSDAISLAKMESHLTSDALRSIPGLRLINDPLDRRLWMVGTSRERASILRSGPGGACLAAVMVDGAMAYSGGEGEPVFDINSIRPEDMAGVEYYGGGAAMPIAYNATRATCGLVVIWTR